MTNHKILSMLRLKTLFVLALAFMLLCSALPVWAEGEEDAGSEEKTITFDANGSFFRDPLRPGEKPTKMYQTFDGKVGAQPAISDYAHKLRRVIPYTEFGTMPAGPWLPPGLDFYYRKEDSFVGWSYTQGGEDAWDELEKLWTYKDLTLYAVWAPNEVHDLWDANGGTWYMDPTEDSPGTLVGKFYIRL